VVATRLHGITFQQTRLFSDENITRVYMVPYSATLVQDLCRDFFKILKVSSLQSQYTHVLLFLINIEDRYKVNSEIHRINTRQKSNLHQI